MSADESALDPESIAALQAVSPDDGGQFFNELVDIFLADTPQRLTEIERCLAEGDAPTLMRAAHSIKGSAGNFGAKALASAAMVIESAARSADFTTIAGRLPGLVSEFERVRTALESVRIR